MGVIPVLESLGYPIPIAVVYAGCLFLFGCCVGSFLNVVSYRLPHGVSLISPGSRCPGCGKVIHAWENIPILSWVLQRARCRGCRLPISWRYPAIELLTGFLPAAHLLRDPLWSPGRSGQRWLPISSAVRPTPPVKNTPSPAANSAPTLGSGTVSRVEPMQFH